MIALTRKCRYALRALFYLAGEHCNGPIPIAQIAKATHAPLDFLEAIFIELRNAQIVESRRGCYGGYVFAMPPQEVSIGAVIRAMDGPLTNLPCLVPPPRERRCADCVDGHTCQTRRFMREVHDSAAAILDRWPISSFSSDAESAQI